MYAKAIVGGKLTRFRLSPELARAHRANKSRAAWAQLDAQLTQAKSLLRQMRQTVEDIEDARTIERAKSAHGKKPRIPWAQVKKELNLD